MPAGQGTLATSVLDVDELNRIESRLEARERRRSVEHAEQLVDALALHRTLQAAGMGLSTPAHLALSMSCSESRASRLIDQAQELHRIGALDAMRAGLLTVEQSAVVVDLLRSLDDALAGRLWQRLAERLETDRGQGVVRPPARLRELLTGWLIAADPDAAAARRKDRAAADADVELWTREDGLIDLVGRALSAADARACQDRIEQLAQPVGPDDTRSGGQRRQQALIDLILGRTALPFDPRTGEVTAGCCPPGSAAPCGAQVFVHVRLDTARGDSSVPAQLVGPGPIDPDALGDLLLAGPVLHRVWVDRNGVPVAVDDRTWAPGRGDPTRLRTMLTDLATGPPPDSVQPRHPDDPGPYRPSRRHQRLVRARAPRCEWPGCGRRASRAGAAGCDLDHDLAWPYGPTCACNLGPLCRRHHRIKQLGWVKHRRADGSIRWTSPTGRSWTSPNQHQAPPGLRPVRRRLIAPGVWALAA